MTLLKKKHGANEMTKEEKEDYEEHHTKPELVPKKDAATHASRKPSGKQGVLSNTAGILRQRKYTKIAAISILGFAVLYSFLYGLWQIPVLQIGFDRMTEVTLVDVTYVVLISVMSGLLVSLLRFKINEADGSKMVGIGGIFAGVVSTACPVCQGITFIALGSTVAAIPLGFLIPYLWVLQIATIFILGLSLYLTSSNIYAKTCISCEISKKTDHKHTEKDPFLYRNNIAFGALVVLTIMLVINNFMITSAFAGAGAYASANGGTINIKPGFEYGPKMTLKPMPLATGENPRFQGYRSIVKPLPTISELSISPSTGDIAQDLVNNVIPRGTPWYGQEAGLSFDDPVAAQQLWAKGRGIQLSSDGQKRWERIVNSFTCDYCCGSPQNPTIITRCGCAHSQAAQGMAKWFIKNYGDKYSDEEIYGEMARWYALWYPGPTIKRIMQELEVAS